MTLTQHIIMKLVYPKLWGFSFMAKCNFLCDFSVLHSPHSGFSFYLLSLRRSRKKSVMVDLDINKVGKNFSWFLDIVKLDIKDRSTICTIQDLKSEEETELLNSSHSG